MDHIYHEKQDGALCGQHCINNLLQDDYFTAVELAIIAEQMDQEEKNRMAESGTHTSDFQQFLEQPSSNMDDSGMFSIQVLTKALETFGLSLVNYASSQSLALNAQKSPIDQIAYICNFREHWFTIRKLGYQWFNLNSLLSFPELISDTYLSLFLKQLQHEVNSLANGVSQEIYKKKEGHKGYSIFLVEGLLPTTKADDYLKLDPAVQTIKPQLLTHEATSSRRSEDQDLQAALAASLVKAGMTNDISQGIQKGYTIRQSQSEEELQAALRLSLQKEQVAAEETNSEDEDEDYKQAIKLSLETSGSSKECSPTKKLSFETNEKDRALEAALQMSLDTSLMEVKIPENPLEPDLEEMRKKRLNKLDKK